MKSVVEAFSLFQRGDIAAAEAMLTELLERTPEDADALHCMAGIQHQKGDLDGAARFFDRAHEVSPFDAEIAFNRAVVLSALGRHAQCVEACVGFLNLRPGDPEALLLQGASLAALGRHEAALAALDQTYEHRADVHARRAGLLLHLGRTEEALTAAARANGIDPRNADAHYHRGQAFGMLELWPEAIEAFDAALALNPKQIAIRAARAPALANVGRFDEALTDIDTALARAPNHAESLARRAYILGAANRYDEALAAWERVLALTPNDPAALYAKCDLLLSAGDFERGLPLYEVRHHQNGRRTPASTAQLWRGQSLEGKTILVQGEQGFGDLFQFSRFIPQLAARGARVILQERAPTLELMRSLEGVVEVAAASEPAPAADFHAPLASLMLLLGARIEAIPAPIAYLHAEPARVARWREVLERPERRLVGVVWSGVTKHAMQKWRSLDKAALAQLLQADVEFVSLQMEESATAAAYGVRQFGAQLADFAELAALIETLDVVVSIDTGVAHLAGALGKPVLLMLPFRADWRWLRERTDTPWYPTMRLFRQKQFGDWQSVIADVRAALQE
ncbi:MAG: tetratricopeptide repeat protein [Alphaproteobacteria bacterium]|nr:tetratricopeptide repeat protein [Alphaproteobacteria bacterium]